MSQYFLSRISYKKDWLRYISKSMFMYYLKKDYKAGKYWIISVVLIGQFVG